MRQIQEHIAFYNKQHERLQENLKKDPHDKELLRQQINAVRKVVNALQVADRYLTVQESRKHGLQALIDERDRILRGPST